MNNDNLNPITTENIRQLGLEFIVACCAAQGQFDEWVESFDAEQLKDRFDRLVAIRTHLNSAVSEARTFLLEVVEW